jgi:uncharacterized Tic20 family protein
MTQTSIIIFISQTNTFGSNLLVMKNSYLANQVKGLRLAKGYSQDYLAMQCKLSLRTIQRIESAQTEPHGDTLQRLAACLEVTVAELVNDHAHSTEHTLPAPLPTDNIYIALIHLSALSFIIFPLLGAIVPFVLWVIKRDKISAINEVSKRVLNFQLTWCLILGACYTIILSGTFFHLRIPAPNLFNLGGAEFYILFIILLYLYNFVVTIANGILAFNSKRSFYYPSLRLLR